MDLTIEYADMCRKALEIQSLSEKGEILLDDHSYWTEDNIWLPRQDELQTFIVGNMKALNISYMDRGRIVCNIYPIRKLQEWSSYEKLWLALVMLFKFARFWDNDIKEWTPVPAAPKIITSTD